MRKIPAKAGYLSTGGWLSMRKLLVISLLLFLLPVPLQAQVSLVGGEYEVIKGDTVLATYSVFKSAVYASLALRADTVSMVPVTVQVDQVQYQVWEQGSIVETFDTKEAATNYLLDNQSDSVTMTEQSVGLGNPNGTR